MQVRWIEPDATIGAQRGDAVVCIAGSDAHLLDTARSVVAHTARQVPLVFCAGPGASGSSAELERLLVGVEQPVWFAAGIEIAIQAAAPADVVLVRSDVLVAGGWLDGLREAAYVDAPVATATALTNQRADVSVGGLPEGLGFDQAAAAVNAGALHNHPRLPAAGRHCVYIRRSALELVGAYEGVGVPDFSQRCLRTGLAHVLADNVLVGSDREAGIAKEPSVGLTDPVARSLAAARRTLHGLSLVIDARVLGGPMNGTKVHVLELIAAIVRTEGAHVTALVRENLDADTRELVRSTGAVLAAVGSQRAASPPLRADVVHRPYQLSDPAEFAYLTRLADRLVVTQLDLIGYHNPSYFGSPPEWEEYRRLIRTALGGADRVVFLSAHARDDALSEGLVESGRASVVHHGVDHAVIGVGPEIPVAPSGLERLPQDAEVILCLGTDYRHKNRVFALRLLDQLRRRHDWRGWLVMAGPPVRFGSSVPDEDALLARRPGLAGALVRLDAVSEAEKAWLLGRASVVAYPSVHEGFGLVPFEAAGLGVPCAWAPGTALSEVIPDSAAAIVPWDAAASADRVLELMRDEHAAARNLQVVREAAAALRWEQAAAQLLDVYRSACDGPQAPAGGLGRTEGPPSSGLSEDAIRLVGPAGALPRDLERPLLALATHPKIAMPVFRAIRAGYRASYRWRRGRSGENGAGR